jgi:hypothetical protein
MGILAYAFASALACFSAWSSLSLRLPYIYSVIIKEPMSKRWYINVPTVTSALQLGSGSIAIL